MTNEKTRKRRNSKRLALSTFIILAILAGTGICLKNHFSESGDLEISAVEVKRGDFVDYVELRGEIAVSSASVIKAPAGVGNLRILRIIPNGTRVREGDEVVTFDPTSLERSAQQYRTALKQAEAEIARVQAQQRLQEEQSNTDVISAEFRLETARLDASTRDVVPAIENEKNLLAVARAEQKIRELDARLASSRMAAEADMAAAVRKKDKAQEDLEQAEGNIVKLVLKSPADGVLSILPNSQARTSLLGGSTPIFKEGDNAYAGAVIAELPDMTTIYAVAPVSESDRGRVDVSQPVVMRVEAVPDRDHLGVVGEISTLAGMDTSSVPPRKSFDLKIQMEQPDDRLRPGMTATMRVEVERVPDAVVISPETVFEKGGRLVVYVLEGKNYRERQIHVARRNETQIMVSSGLEPGERIAAKDPTLDDAPD
jgi:multidrug resistance efflux pump